MTEKSKRCPPCPRKTCPGGCYPGKCLNASCTYRLHDHVVLSDPEIEMQAAKRRQCIEKAKQDHQKKERLKSFAEDRRAMGMASFANTEIMNDIATDEFSEASINQCPKFNLRDLKAPEPPKTMRDPARPSCMLVPPAFSPPSDDYSDLSRFLRISTMPGYSNNELVSEYHDNHNMAVWNKRKEIDPQVYKMKRDWLSVWGEFNVVEQRWKKAWNEKYGV